MNFEPIKPHTVIGFGLWNIMYMHCSIKTTYIHCIFIWFLCLYLLATQTMQSIDCRAFNYEIPIFFAIFQKSSTKKWMALFCFHGVIYNIRILITHLKYRSKQYPRSPCFYIFKIQAHIWEYLIHFLIKWICPFILLFTWTRIFLDAFRHNTKQDRNRQSVFSFRKFPLRNVRTNWKSSTAL